MKKIFLFAAAAAMLTACSSEELAGTESAQQKAGEAPISFSVYTPRSITRSGSAVYADKTKGLETSDLKTLGLGILAYYTDDEKYDADKSTPNFMYNTKVTYGTSGTWEYNPVMYWPNEFKNASSENIDRVSFFAYAPYVEVDNITGIPYADQANWETDKKLITTEEKNITAISKNTATGDPVVKYVVDTNPATSVDLLWGVASNEAATRYTAIDNTNSGVTVTPGKPFLDLVKPNEPRWKDGTNPVDGGVLSFNMCHALSKLNIDVKFIADAATPDGTSADINANETRIYIRSIKIGGFVMKAALDLNSKETQAGSAPSTVRGKALWKDYDGKSALSWSDNVKFYDGRKDGKEGTESGDNLNESYLGLNPYLLENYVNDVWGGTEWVKTEANGGKNRGITKTAQNLFWNGEGTEPDANLPIYVIPVGDDIDITIEYDVLTADGNLSEFLSDGLTHGKMIKNTITKKSKEIFKTTEPVKMEDGKSYTIHLILGMTSVKIEATVTDFEAENATANLPQNQD